MNTDDIYREAFHLLEQHASKLARILADLESPFDMLCEKADDAFRAYPMCMTWWNRNVYRIYLSVDTVSEHLDLHVDRALNPGTLVYHLELLEGPADLVIDFENPIYRYAVMTMQAYGDTTY